MSCWTKTIAKRRGGEEAEADPLDNLYPGISLLSSLSCFDIDDCRMTVENITFFETIEPNLSAMVLL